MYKGLTLFNVASALASHAGARQSIIARNIANSETPGFKARDLTSFGDAYAQGGVRQALRTSRPGHQQTPLQPNGAALVEGIVPGDAAPNGNTVSVETEMMKASEVRFQHNMAVSVYRSGIDLLRSGLGRG
ncbi:FlgB family protein [Pseudoruegeria sp. SK021]|uniref:FlgB family protein n=1 Tax=Pseudoruegeria sp. SK021 TaxID=1933035 RepID=UPI000A3210C0|nr:FlgB family protein [Pseudoruegeria sp. SK021]